MARILIAEDDTAMRQFLAMALERAGHTVTACENGQDAFNTLVENTEAGFDLLLSDIVMPGMDGIELSRRAMAAMPTLKILFITGFAAVAADAAHQAQTLSKPFHLNDLVNQVERILASDTAHNA